MNERLEEFVNDHREDFDNEEPAAKIWDNIRKQVEPAEKKQAPVVPMHRIKWSVAAAIAVLIGCAALVVKLTSGNKEKETLARQVQKPAVKGNDLPKVQPSAIDTASPEIAHQPVVKPKSEVAAPDDQAADLNEEMYHFARLVEIRHKELRKIEKDEPLLYKQFAGDVNKLDSVYQSLKQQLPQNANREQLIEAMIQNLQLQMDLLNHQLSIIKQINHSKKSAYEKAFKSA